MMKDNKNIDNSNGILNVNGYIVWKKVEIVRLFIFKYLKNIFPNNLILHEFNKIDMLILDENIPIEIQSTITDKNSVKHAHFEDKIRRQIEDNIENYGKCWFFFDAEYYRYLNESEKCNISLNLDWLAKYVKEEKLKIFIVKYTGEIKELKYEDLGFIRKLSNTCKAEYDDDLRILNRNKIYIIGNILKGHDFTQEEIDKFRNDFYQRESTNNSKEFSEFLRKDKDERRRIYGNVLHSMGDLNDVNDLLNMNENYKQESKTSCGYLGIFKIEGSSSASTTQFIDRFNICQYFPGYMKHKEAWDSIKENGFSDRGLRDYFWTKNHQMKMKNLMEY